MRSWLLGIVLTSLAVGLARQIAPQGKEQSMVRLTGGLLLALAILRPLAGQNWERLELDTDSLRLQETQLADAYRKNQQDTLSAIIAEKTEAYICDKAKQLGLSCTAAVTVSPSEGGIPLPVSVAIRGQFSGELSSWLEEEVGIPAKMQTWLEEEAWQTRKENEN